jgi:hypothetical protein
MSAGSGRTRPAWLVESNQQDHDIDGASGIGVLEMTDVMVLGAILVLVLVVLKVSQSLGLLEKVVFHVFTVLFCGVSTERWAQNSHFVIKLDLHSSSILTDRLKVVVVRSSRGGGSNILLQLDSLSDS